MRRFKDTRPGELVVLTSPGFLQEVFEKIRPQLDPARQAGYDISRVYLMLDEMLSNTYRHGYQRAPGLPIGVEVHVRGDVCRVVVRDLAPTYDSALNARTRSLPTPESGDPGGRGLVIVYRMCESFEHMTPPEGGNVVVLVMKLLRRAPAPIEPVTAADPEDSHS